MKLKLAIACAAMSALCLSSCKKNHGPKTPASMPMLQRIVDSVSVSSACASAIPDHWSASWPVPVIVKGQLAYKVFFYGRSNRHGALVPHEAEGDALFLESGRVLECSRRLHAGDDLDRPYKRASPDEIARLIDLEHRIYDQLDHIARLYASGRVLEARDHRSIAKFNADFWPATLSGHARAYHSLNPEFWKWAQHN